MPGAASRGCCSSERGGTALTQRGPAAATQGMLDRMDHRHLVLTPLAWTLARDRKSTRLNSSHTVISYAVFCLKKKKITTIKRIKHQYRSSNTNTTSTRA